MLQPGRKYEATSSYRYGFNGKENDNDVKGEGNQQDYGMRIYDPRLGRFLSVDPLTQAYPWYTPYQFAGNSPIANIDLDGGEPKPSTIGTDEGQTTQTNEKRSFSYGVAGTGGAVTYTATKKWNWHAGGLSTGKFKVSEDKKTQTEILTQAGWYDSQGYLDVLASTVAAQQLADEIGFYKSSHVLQGGSEALSKFVGGGLSENASNYLIAAAERINNNTAFMRSGFTESGGFNVEDMLGLGLLAKAGIKMLGTYTAKNILNSVPKNSLFQDIYVKVGHWCSKENYNLMKTTGKVVEEEGGQSFFSINGPDSWNAAPKGWVYSEFEVSAKSLIQGGQWDWWKAVFPTANNSMKTQVLKQGGALAPDIKNLTDVLQIK